MAFSSNTVFLYFSMKLVDIKQGGLGDIGIIGTTKKSPLNTEVWSVLPFLKFRKMEKTEKF